MTPKQIQKEAEEFAKKKFVFPDQLYGYNPEMKAAYIAGRTKSLKEIQRLKNWVESASEILNDIDLPQCAKLLNVPLGGDISKHILPAIQSLQSLESQLQHYKKLFLVADKVIWAFENDFDKESIKEYSEYQSLKQKQP